MCLILFLIALVVVFTEWTVGYCSLKLKLPTLKYRRLRSGMIEVLFKILTGKYDTNVTFSFENHQDCRTKGHNLKLVNHRCHYDLRKYFLYTINKY